MSYYHDHSKKIKDKKKRPRPKTGVTPSGSLSNLNFGNSSHDPTKPLTNAGWALRYDFKLAVFAEFQSKYSLAVKLYEGVYQSLVDMINNAVSSSVLLSSASGDGADFLIPFTPRWEEAKLLADCLSYKISKLLLFYLDAPVQSLYQFSQNHIANFRHLPEFAYTGPHLNTATDGIVSLSSKFGRGGSVECWTWSSMSYRSFAQLIVCYGEINY